MRLARPVLLKGFDNGIEGATLVSRIHGCTALVLINPV